MAQPVDPLQLPLIMMDLSQHLFPAALQHLHALSLPIRPHIPLCLSRREADVMKRHEQAHRRDVRLIMMVIAARPAKLLIFPQDMLGNAAASFCFISGHAFTLFSDNCIVEHAERIVKYLSCMSEEKQPKLLYC